MPSCYGCTRWKQSQKVDGAPCVYKQIVVLPLIDAVGEGLSNGTLKPHDSNAEGGKDLLCVCTHCKDAAECLRAFGVIFLHHGMEDAEGLLSGPQGWASFIRFRELSIHRQLLPYLKWKTTASFAWCLKLPLPDRPDCVSSLESHDLFGGPFYKFLRARKRQVVEGGAERRRSLRFFLALLMSKRGLPRPDKSMLDQQALETGRVLTSQVGYNSASGLPFAFERWRDDPATGEMKDLAGYVTAVCSALFGKAERFDSEPLFQWPSPNAHIGAPRKNGGAHAEIVQDGMDVFIASARAAAIRKKVTLDSVLSGFVTRQFAYDLGLAAMLADSPVAMNQAEALLKRIDAGEKPLMMELHAGVLLSRGARARAGLTRSQAEREKMWACPRSLPRTIHRPVSVFGSTVQLPLPGSDSSVSELALIQRHLLSKRLSWSSDPVWVQGCNFHLSPLPDDPLDIIAGFAGLPSVRTSALTLLPGAALIYHDGSFDEDWIVQEEVLLPNDPTIRYWRWRTQQLAVQRSLLSDFKAKPHALAEALKIRVITLGEVDSYAALGPLQKWLWRVTKVDKRFAVGGPITPEFVGKMLGELNEGVGERWCSGDYKAATDNLNPYLAMIAVSAICDAGGVPDDYRALFERALCGHQILVSAPKTPEVYLPQSAGQLMGSPVSFPILCIINFAVIWMAMDEHGDLPFEEVRTIINGDDCLFAARPSVYLRWERTAKLAGLTPSVGKSYWSDEIQVINSMLLDYSERRPHSEVRGKKLICFITSPIIPDLNLGLLFGVHRDGSAADMSLSRAEFADDAGSRCRRLLVGADAEEAHCLVKLFCKYNHNGDRKTNIPWFLPHQFGGLGLPAVYQSTVVDDLVETEFSPGGSEYPQGLVGVATVTRSYRTTCVDTHALQLIGPTLLDRQCAAVMLARADQGRPVTIPTGGTKRQTAFRTANRCFRACFPDIVCPSDTQSGIVGSYIFDFIDQVPTVNEHRDDDELQKFWQRFKSSHREVFSALPIPSSELEIARMTRPVAAFRMVEPSSESPLSLLEDPSFW